jgi:hypothetical protein
MEPLTMFGRTLGFYGTLLKKHCSKSNNRILRRLCCPWGKTEFWYIILTISDTQILCFNCFCVQTFESHHHRWYVKLLITISYSRTHMTDSTDTASSPENWDCKRQVSMYKQQPNCRHSMGYLCNHIQRLQFFFLWCFNQILGHELPLQGFVITFIGHTTLGRTPLDEWSTQCGDLYLTKTQPSQERNTGAPNGTKITNKTKLN